MAYSVTPTLSDEAPQVSFGLPAARARRNCGGIVGAMESVPGAEASCEPICST